MWSMYLFFVYSYVVSKTENKVTMWLKNSNHWLVVRLNLSSETKEIVKKQRLFKKGILNLACKQGLLSQKSKQTAKFRESKTCKSVRKLYKTRSGIKF